MSVSVARGPAMNYPFGGTRKALPFFRPSAHISDAPQKPSLLSRVFSTSASKSSDGASSASASSNANTMSMSMFYAPTPRRAPRRPFSIYQSSAVDTYVYEASVCSSKSSRSRASWAASDNDSTYSFARDEPGPRRRSMLFRGDDDDDDDDAYSDTGSVDSEARRRDPREVVPVDLPQLIAPLLHSGIVTVPLPPPSANSSDSSDSDATLQYSPPPPAPPLSEQLPSPSRTRTPAPASFLSSRPPPQRRATVPASVASGSNSGASPPGLSDPPRPRRASSLSSATPAHAPTPANSLGSGSGHDGAFSPPPPPPPPLLPLEGLANPCAPRPLSRAASHRSPAAPLARAPSSRSSSGPTPASPFARPSGPAPRGVRWDAQLVCPSPVPPERRRRGWFNRRGDQLWTNAGAFRPATPGAEFPPDLRMYPAPGMGWMNEDGTRIDMRHRLVPKGPMKSALKKGGGGGGGGS